MTRCSTVLAMTAVALLLCAGDAAAARAAHEDCDAAAASIRSQLESTCPCDTASNRADHLRCVMKKLRELSECKKDATGNKDCGPVPRQCVGKVRRMAAGSTCGQPDLVTCCLPRQQDCRNDPHPGDGKAEGTCARTNKPCDKIEDCVIAKCQPSPSADKCVAAGGTVGKSGDCATACAL